MANSEHANTDPNSFDPRATEQRDKRSLRRRMIAFGIAAGAVFLVFVFRLAQFQLLGG